MNLSAIRKGAFVLAIVASANVAVAQDETTPTARSASLLDRLELSPWATVVTDQEGFRLRLLTEQEKNDAKKTIHDYRESRSQEERDDALSKAYLTMPSDVRGDRFYAITRCGSDAIELRADDIRAIVPLASIRVFLIGPQGTFSGGGPFDRRATARTTRSARSTPQEFIEALRGERGAAGGRSRGVADGALAGLLGGAAPAKRLPNAKHPPTPKILYLKYAKAESIVEVIDEVFSGFDMRIATETRLNALIMQCEPELFEQVEKVIEALDRENVHGPKEPVEEPTLRTFSLEGADAKTVLNVLQTLFRGTADVRISVDETANRIIVLGRKSDHETIKATIDKIAAPAE